MIRGRVSIGVTGSLLVCSEELEMIGSVEGGVGDDGGN